MRRTIRAILRRGLVLAAAIAAGLGPAGATDRHAGYYYPEHTSETYISRAQMMADASRERRIGFVTQLTGEQLTRPYAPEYAIFAKGDEADRLIIVALNAGAIASVYQARAVLAQLTAVARSTEFFRTMAVEDLFTFFDLARILGFKRITVSDGRTYAHQVTLQ